MEGYFTATRDDEDEDEDAAAPAAAAAAAAVVMGFDASFEALAAVSLPMTAASPTLLCKSTCKDKKKSLQKSKISRAL